MGAADVAMTTPPAADAAPVVQESGYFAQNFGIDEATPRRTLDAGLSRGGDSRRGLPAAQGGGLRGVRGRAGDRRQRLSGPQRAGVRVLLGDQDGLRLHRGADPGGAAAGGAHRGGDRGRRREPGQPRRGSAPERAAALPARGVVAAGLPGRQAVDRRPAPARRWRRATPR
ncbi:MAG: hypothetical protein MZV63_06175 [Marinilabiliales bacterium]|nr:hypothetical protein [Marinilabiliales bacterium]